MNLRWSRTVTNARRKLLCGEQSWKCARSVWGYTYTADWQIEAQAHEIKEHSLVTLERQWRETMEFLSGYLNLYQIHSATVAQIISNLQACHLNIDRATATRWSELAEPPELNWSTRSKLPWN